MIYWDRLYWKFQKAKRIITEGRYSDLLDRISANMPALLNSGKRDDAMKYSSLHEKYKGFIAEHVSVKTLTGGGG